MKGRKIRDESDARACLALMRSSRLELSEWARSNGVDGRSLHAWRINLEESSRSRKRTKRSAPAAPRLRLVELIPTRATPSLSTYVIRVGERSVEVRDGFDESTLRRLLAVLGTC